MNINDKDIIIITNSFKEFPEKITNITLELEQILFNFLFLKIFNIQQK